MLERSRVRPGDLFYFRRSFSFQLFKRSDIPFSIRFNLLQTVLQRLTFIASSLLSVVNSRVQLTLSNFSAYGLGFVELVVWDQRNGWTGNGWLAVPGYLRRSTCGASRRCLNDHLSLCARSCLCERIAARARHCPPPGPPRPPPLPRALLGPAPYWKLFTAIYNQSTTINCSLTEMSFIIADSGPHIIFTCLSVCPSICPFVCLCPSIYLLHICHSVCLFMIVSVVCCFFSTSVSLSHSLDLSVCMLSVWLCLYVCLSVWLSSALFDRLPSVFLVAVRQQVCLSLYVCICRWYVCQSDCLPLYLYICLSAV